MGKENNMTPYIFTKEDTKLLKGGGGYYFDVSTSFMGFP